MRLAVSLAFALTSFYALERPVRQRRVPTWMARAWRRLTLRRSAGAGAEGPLPSVDRPRWARHPWVIAVPTIAAALVAALLVATSGATTPAPLADTVTAVRASLDDVAPPPAAPVAGAPPRILFTGDSVSYFLAQEVLARQDDFGIVAASAALPGCRFTPGRIRRADGQVVEDTQWPMCDTLWTEAVDRVRPDLVFLTVADPGAVDREVERQWTTPCDERFDRYLRSKLTAAVDTLSATGAVVVLGTSVRAMPTYANGVIPEHLDCFNQTIRSVVAADPRTRLVDVDGFVCPDGTCTDEVDGRPLRLDGLHFVGPAADYVDAWLVPQLLQQLPPG